MKSPKDGKMYKTDSEDMQGIVAQNSIIPLNQIYYSYFVDVVPIR